MFCPKCGKELPSNAVFCSGCGTNIHGHTFSKSPEFQYGGEDLNEDLSALEAVVGKNTNYYLTEFRKIEVGMKSRFNWSAFFLGPIMCFYRRAPELFKKYYLLLYTIPVIVGLVMEVAFILTFNLWVLLFSVVPIIGFQIFSIVRAIQVGKNFNKDYYEHCQKQLLKADFTKYGVSKKNVVLWFIVVITIVVILYFISLSTMTSFLMEMSASGNRTIISSENWNSSENILGEYDTSNNIDSIIGEEYNHAKNDSNEYPEMIGTSLEQVLVDWPSSGPNYSWFNQSAKEILAEVHVNEYGEFVDEYGTPVIEANILYTEYMDAHPSSDLTDYGAIINFCMNARVDCSEYIMGQASMGFASDPTNVEQIDFIAQANEDSNIWPKPGDEIWSAFSLIDYAEFATTGQYFDTIHEMNEIFNYWANEYAYDVLGDATVFEYMNLFAGVFGCDLDLQYYDN